MNDPTPAASTAALRLAARMRRVSASAIMELIKTTAGGDYISFASGLPDPSLFPAAELRRAADAVLGRDGSALQYGPAEGIAALREIVAEILTRRGLPTRLEEVLITSGSQQAIDLVARALIDPGDTIVVESPTYLAALQAFDSYEARYRTVPMDGEGMRTDALSGLSMSGVRLLYTLPNFQNPTGLTLSETRRRELARAAAAAGAALLEDDAYYDLLYDGDPLPPVCGMAVNPSAVYIGSFSKVIAPGLRVGYLRANAALIDRLAQLKQMTDLHTGTLSQRIVVEYCRQGWLEPGIARFREAYRSRRDTMLAALETELSGTLRPTRPRGGMFLFAALPAGRRAGELLRLAMEAGVVFVPGDSFHPDGGGQNTLRLNFVSAPEERIREGIARLVAVMRRWLA